MAISNSASSDPPASSPPNGSRQPPSNATDDLECRRSCLPCRNQDNISRRRFRKRLNIRLQVMSPRPTLPQVSQPDLPQPPSNTFTDAQTVSNTPNVQPASTSPNALTMAAVPNIPLIHDSGVAQETISYFEGFDLDLLAATSPLPDIEFTASDFDMLSNPLSPANPSPANPHPASGQNTIPITSDTPRDRKTSCVKCFRPRPSGNNTQEDQGLCRACYAKLRRAQLRAARQWGGQASRD
ncbi:hypothetical protein NCS56_00963900 [Fusarium sp. Ph1]|nr:hypothetical protein NCS56_00963900 [Fusarium sp. Ph1]